MVSRSFLFAEFAPLVLLMSLCQKQKKSTSHNQVAKHNAKLGDEYNNFQLKLCCLLGDKTFLTESLNFVASKLTGMKSAEHKNRLQSSSLPIPHRECH